MSRVYAPITSPSDWQKLLAQPDLHWKPGRSAHSLAHAWQRAATTPDGLPAEVRRVLAQLPPLASAEVLAVLPEHQTPLPGGSRPSCTDALVLAHANDGLAVIGVEGKAGESFGPTVEEWLGEPSPGKTVRLDFLTRRLGLDGVAGTIRYQLLHRTVSALLEAERFVARHAVLLIHAWSNERAGFDDFAAFAGLLGVSVEPNVLASVSRPDGPALHLAWVDGATIAPSDIAAS